MQEGRAVHTLVVKSTDSTGVRDMSPADQDTIGRIQFEVIGITAAGGSCTPQVRGYTSTTYYNKSYQNFTTETAVTAGTAIAADGIYEMLVDGCVGSLNITTVGSAGWTVKVTPLAG